jgi:serine/threonine-protein kinase
MRLMSETTKMRGPPGPGSVIAVRYKLIAPLGHGGMGTVWRAEHLTLHSPVAIKLIADEALDSDAMRTRFLREAQSAASLRSPHVVQILDHGIDDGIPYIAMELMEGETLAQRLQRLGRLSYKETLRVVTHITRAVARAHSAGIVHRDLKPDNVFLVENDEEEIAKVLDFGIAKSQVPGMDSGATTRTGAVLGTPYYMSPEQLQGAKDVDHQADLWSIGVIAFECLCGQRPFDSDTFANLILRICSHAPPRPSQLAQVPDGFDEWFFRAVAHEPSERFESAKAMARALRMVVEGDAGPTEAPTRAIARGGVPAHTGTPETLAGTEHAAERSRAPSEGRRAALALAGVLLLGGTIALLAMRSRGTDSSPIGEASALANAPSSTALEPDQSAPAAPTEVPEIAPDLTAPPSASVAPSAAPKPAAPKPTAPKLAAPKPAAPKPAPTPAVPKPAAPKPAPTPEVDLGI